MQALTNKLHRCNLVDSKRIFAESYVTSQGYECSAVSSMILQCKVVGRILLLLTWAGGLHYIGLLNQSKLLILCFI